MIIENDVNKLEQQYKFLKSHKRLLSLNNLFCSKSNIFISYQEINIIKIYTDQEDLKGYSRLQKVNVIKKGSINPI